MLVEILFSLFVAVGAPIVACYLTYCLYKIINKVLDTKRREQHPAYFALFDAAMEQANKGSEHIEREADYLEFHFNMLRDGLRDGECTEEYFKKRLDQLSERYFKACQYHECRVNESKILFKAADEYAKKHDLPWGVLY